MGLRRIYGYPGDGINGILGALQHAGDAMEFVQVRHEEMAAFMACGHAKFTRQVGAWLARRPAPSCRTTSSRCRRGSLAAATAPLIRASATRGPGRHETARGVQIDIDARMLSIRYPMDVNPAGDSATTLRLLRPRKQDRSWREQIDADVADRPTLIDVCTDPDVPPLPPHVSFAQARACASSLLKGDSDTIGVVRQSLKEIFS